MKPQHLLSPLFLVALASCAILPVKEECASGFMMSGDDCVPVSVDGGGNDGGQDMAQSDLGVDEGMPDAGACGMPCTGATPVCNETTGECVECTAGATAACTGATPLCDAAASECVACLANSDCTTAGASECALATHMCVGCTADAACTRLTATPVCDEAGAECVACTGDTEAARCGANSCNPATNACTTTPRTSVLTCRACVADSECVADHRCVAMNFMGTARTGGYCLKRFSTGCSEPYTVPTSARASLSAVAAEAYCGVNEAVTTCEAVAHMIGNRACAASTDTDCGATGVDDGLCRTVSGVMNRCTYACDAASRCPLTFSCDAGYCGS